MANWCIKSADILKPYYNLLKEQMINEHIINADETPFLLSKDGREAGSKSYMWVYRAGAHHEEDKKIVLYDYQPTRRADHPREFLNGFKGIVMSDGYQVYHKLEKERPDELVVAGCWAHAKRKFSEVVKANNKNNKVGNSLSSQAIQMITKIFHETNLLDDLPYEECKKARQTKIKLLVDQFFEWAKKHQYEVAPKSGTGEGFTYVINQEKYLRTFLDYPEIPMTNNAAEQAIRSFTVGRKNWVMIDTISGADSSAILYSIVETAKANKLKIYNYINYLLEEMPKYVNKINPEISESLLPWSKDFPKELFK